MSTETIQSNEYLRLRDAAKYLGISRPTLWRLQNNDKSLPRVIRITSRCCVFRKADLDAYLQLKQEV